MKKELLMASALVSTMGVASVAQAVTATMSGHHDTGLQGSNPELSTSDDSIAVTNNSSFSVSLSETTDGGVGISTSFMLANESVDGGLGTAGFTLAFTDGSKLDVINAGNAAKSHDIAVPGGAGKADGITITSSNTAQSDLDFFGVDTGISFEWHSAADFMADGLKIGASYSVDNGAAAGASTKLDSSWGLGATYVTSAGDTAVTVGAGIADSTYKDSGTNPSNNSGGFHVGFSAVTGNLTVAVGFADGDKVNPTSSTNAEHEISDNSITKVGVKYVSGDMTLSAGLSSADGMDSDTIGTKGTTADSVDITQAGISYAVASGVTANLGWKSTDSNDEGSSETSGGSSWYIGASMSF
jgi:hypothetical protein